MAETVDARIRVVIAGAAVPAGESCVRTELDHAEWDYRTGECVAVPAGADAYLIKCVLMDWGDDNATTLLRNCAAAIARAWACSSRLRRSVTSQPTD